MKQQFCFLKKITAFPPLEKKKPSDKLFVMKFNIIELKFNRNQKENEKEKQKNTKTNFFLYTMKYHW